MIDEVVIFCGKMGSGKDFHSQELVDNEGFVKMAFADTLREMTFGMLGIPFEEGMRKYDELKKSELYNGRTLRDMLQYLGTEGIRKYDNDFWVNALIKKLDRLPDGTKVCVSDARFYNEYNLLKQYCSNNNIKFRCIFCDFHSDRYALSSGHASERLGEFLCEKGLQHYTDVTDEIMQEYYEQVELPERQMYL